jgi:hypothetical protein
MYEKKTFINDGTRYLVSAPSDAQYSLESCKKSIHRLCRGTNNASEAYRMTNGGNVSASQILV